MAIAVKTAPDRLHADRALSFSGNPYCLLPNLLLPTPYSLLKLAMISATASI